MCALWCSYDSTLIGSNEFSIPAAVDREGELICIFQQTEWNFVRRRSARSLLLFSSSNSSSSAYIDIYIEGNERTSDLLNISRRKRGKQWKGTTWAGLSLHYECKSWHNQSLKIVFKALSSFERERVEEIKRKGDLTFLSKFIPVINGSQDQADSVFHSFFARVFRIHVATSPAQHSAVKVLEKLSTRIEN